MKGYSPAMSGSIILVPFSLYVCVPSIPWFPTWGTVQPNISLVYMDEVYLLAKSSMYWGACLATWCKIGNWGASRGIRSWRMFKVPSLPNLSNAYLQAVLPCSSFWKRRPASSGWRCNDTSRKVGKAPHVMGQCLIIEWKIGRPLHLQQSSISLNARSITRTICDDDY